MGILRFSPYGWSSRYDEDFTESNVVRIAEALGAAWQRRRPGGRVLVGYDGRFRSEEFALTAGQAIASFGLDAVVSLDVCPLPALAWSAARDKRCVGALMVTGSERPCEYNGLVARGSDGGPITSAFAREVERRVGGAPSGARGEVSRGDITTTYLDDLGSLVNLDLIAEKCPRVVVDPMYGAASHHLLSLLTSIGCSVTELHAAPRDDFAGLHPEAIEPWADECEQVVTCQRACAGLVIGGDGDRAALIDERGHLVSPHNLAPLVLDHLVRNKGMHGRVVTTYSSSVRLSRQAKALGLPLTVVPAGFDRIYGEVLQEDVLMGSEEYGGICLPAHLNERDGLLAGLLALELMAMEERSLSQLIDDLVKRVGRMEYARRDIRLDPATASSLGNILPGMNPATLVGKKPVVVNHADGLRLSFNDDSWAMIRPSRAGYLVRVYAEAPDPAGRDALLSAACALARRPDLWRGRGESERRPDAGAGGV